MMTARIVPILLAAGVLAAPAQLNAQQDSAAAKGKMSASAPSPVVTQHTATIGGQRVDYDATVGSITLKDDKDEPTARIYYTAYTRRGTGDVTHRAITFAYNGGPGSASIWLHLGALGPRRVTPPDTAHAPPPPYTLVDNQYSLLDATDLVMIDPVGTGFSRPLGKATGKDFWGVDEDAASLGQFISRYLSENGRWNSPRYLLGESYGTTRSAALVNYLQSRLSMDMNGVVLVSAVLDFQTISFNPGNDMPFIFYLPSYAAVAWYHHALQDRPAELEPFLKEVEQFATTDYAQALLAGSALEQSKRNAVLDRLARYTGLSRDYLDKADLRVSASQFEKELMREHGLVVGRLDARFTGPTGDLLAEDAPYDPQSSAISSAYTSSFHTYLRNELNFRTEMQYRVSGNVQPWNWSHGGRGGWPGYTNVAVDLAQALSRNPKLHVLLLSGLYDLATPYFAAISTMDHLGLPPELRAHVTHAEFPAGHMMYVQESSLAAMKKAIASFMAATMGGISATTTTR